MRCTGCALPIERAANSMAIQWRQPNGIALLLQRAARSLWAALARQTMYIA